MSDNTVQLKRVVIELGNGVEMNLTTSAQFDDKVRATLGLNDDEELTVEHYRRFMLIIVKQTLNSLPGQA